jgi:predicted Zn-dependent protease
MSPTLKQIKKLIRKEKYSLALENLEQLLLSQQESPYLWTMRGDLIQLIETENGPPLKQAAISYRKALKLDPHDLYAIKSLARFYYAVDQQPAKAKEFAASFVEKATQGISEMEQIISE